MHSIFKACDIRGLYGQELTEEKVRRVGAAVAVLLRRRGREVRVLVGGDVRLSTPSLKAALLEGLTGSGAACVDLGTVPTPLFYFARRRLGVPAGVMVTASHNAAPHNGLKLVLGELPVTGEELSELRALAAANCHEPAPGSVTSLSIEKDYSDFLLGAADELLPPEARRLRLVVDPGNGSWAGLAGRLLRDAGCQVGLLNDVADGRFPGRDPNPSVPTHLAGLGARVVAEGAALGIAFDGDGDRVAFADDRGRPVSSDAAAMLLVRALVPSEPGARVVHDIKCSQAVADEIRRCGGVPLMERSGHTFIKTRVLVEGALFAPEASGHYFFRVLEGGDDGLYCALVLLGALARAGQPLSTLVDALPRYATTPDIRVRYPGDPAPLLERIAAAFPPDQVSRLDGVRVQFRDGWGLARPSVTEAALTLRFEGRTEPARAAVQAAFLAPVPELAALLP
ncbi:MAG: phosphomannomutase/phosphoglucomutase [Armatimonadetes bacterium]|jgi:phosphomannomutase/phosphoglucomutase|nr:phosphomannomutase/phosphoglucomutase [Armatimonadota bacterium]